MLLFGSCNTTRRTVRFGMLTDIHYAERDPLNDRYYAQAMEKLCAAIGFTKEMIESLLTKKEAIRCNGRIYSEEHRRKFDIKNDIFKVEKNPTDDSKLMLTINRQPIGEWFKEQFGKLGHGFQKTPDEPKKRGGFRL